MSPAPIHQALDRVTVLTIQVQQLRRRLGHAEDVEATSLEQSLEAIEGELRDLSAVLAGIRDQT
jgi:hypothetical protein